MIIPVFALANAGIALDTDTLSAAVTSPVTLGIAVGLVVGKTVGIAGAVFVAVRTGVAPLPAQATSTQVIGVCALAGIGFTVSLFITGLAFDDAATVSEAKIGILAASIVAAVLGATILLRAGAAQPEPGLERELGS